MANITTREVGSTATGTPLSNAQIDNNFINLNTEIGTKQDTLVSGTSIKTVNNQSVLGSGNIQIDGGVTSFNTRTGAITLGAADVPGLDASKIITGTIDAARLPSYVDDVLEAANLASFPSTGETGKIYVALDSNKVYRWSGSTYVYITSGAVDSVAGKTGVVTLSNSDVGLGNVENKSSATIRGELTSANVTGALGFTPYNSTNPSGYITSSASITGSAATNSVAAAGALDPQKLPNQHPVSSVSYDNSNQFPGLGDFYSSITIRGRDNFAWQIIGPSYDSAYGSDENEIYVRAGNGTTWSPMRGLIHSGNIGFFSPSKTGVGAQGTWNINVTGSAGAVAWSGVSGTPTTLAGYGITDAQALDADLTAIAGLAGTSGFLKKTAANTWALDTTTYLTGINSSQVTTALGFTPYNSTNPSGYITSSALSSYLPLSGGTISGPTFISSGNNYPLQLISTQRYMLQLRNSNNSVNSNYGWWLATDTNFDFVLHADGQGDRLTLGRSNNILSLGGNTVLHAGNSTSYPSAYAPLLSAVGSYSFSASTNGRDFAAGVQAGFVSDGQGYPSYGSVVRVKTYSNDGGTAELYFPYSATYGGSAMRYRMGQYDNAGWTDWKTVLDSSNYTGYALPLAGGTVTGRVVLTNDGQGLGSETLHVKGDIRAQRGTGNTGVIYFGSSTGTYLYYDGSNYHMPTGQLDVGGNRVLTAGNYSSYALPLSGGTLSGGLVVSSGGISQLQLTSPTGTQSLWIRAGYTANGTGTPISSPYNVQFQSSGSSGGTFTFVTGNDVTLSITGSAVNSSVALQQSGNQVLHAGNYSSFALPLSGGTVSGNLGLGVSPDIRLSVNGEAHISSYLYMGGTAGSYTSWGSRDYTTSGSRYINANYFEVNNYGYGSTWSFAVDGSSSRYNGNVLLHAGNYTSYSPSLTGSGASGTWGISVSGNAATATRTSSVSGYAHAGTGMHPFYNWGGSGGGDSAPSDSTYTIGISVGSHPSDPAYGFQIARNMWATGLWTRGYDSSFGSWVRLLDSSNYTSYALPLSGGTIAGNGSIDFGPNSSWGATLRVGGNGHGGTGRASVVTTNGNLHLDGAASSGIYLNWYATSTTGTYFGNGAGGQVGRVTASGSATFSGLIDTPAGYVSNGNPWGTSNSAFFPNGITTAGGTNWIYGSTYIGNAPGNGSGLEVASNGRLYSVVSTGTAMHIRRSGSASNATNAYTALFENDYGDHSWGIVAEFRAGGSGGSDRPSIMFSNGYNSNTWSVGFGWSDDQFRIRQNHGHRNGDWGTERFRIDTGGTPYFNGNVALHAGNYSDYAVKINDWHGNLYHHTDGRIYSTIYYDANDSAYYVDANNGSRLAHIYAGNVASSNDGGWNARFNLVGSSHARLDVVSNSDGIITTMYSHVGQGVGRVGTYSNHPLVLMAQGGADGGYVYNGSLRSSMFYDSNDTSYYLDPNGTSYQRSLFLGAHDSGTSEFRFGEDSSGWYGDRWYWDSSYTLYRYSRYAGTDSLIHYHDTRDASRITYGRNIVFDDYGKGIVGTYSSYRYQGVFSMGDSYKLPADGTTTGNLYGMAWSHPNAGGTAGNLNTHGLLILENGGFLAAVSGSIRSRDDMRSPIFYDSNDTSRYLDLNGTSIFAGSQYFIANRNTSSDSPALQAYSDNGSGAIMSFHRGGYYAVNFGLDSDNVMRIGGWSASTNRWQLDMSGNGTYAGNVTAYSDERLKTDWKLLPDDYVQRLAKLKSGTYTRIDSGERQAGSSAQDWQNLLPEVVSTSNDEAKTLALAYGNAALVSAIELAKRVVEQDLRIAKLEALVERLLAK